MKLTVFVHDQPVATLDSPDGFEHVLSYHPSIKDEQFVSLLACAHRVLRLPGDTPDLSDELA